jgi:hypothetical protein
MSDPIFQYYAGDTTYSGKRGAAFPGYDLSDHEKGENGAYIG